MGLKSVEIHSNGSVRMQEYGYQVEKNLQYKYIFYTQDPSKKRYYQIYIYFFKYNSLYFKLYYLE